MRALKCTGKWEDGINHFYIIFCSCAMKSCASCTVRNTELNGSSTSMRAATFKLIKMFSIQSVFKAKLFVCMQGMEPLSGFYCIFSQQMENSVLVTPFQQARTREIQNFAVKKKGANLPMQTLVAMTTHLGEIFSYLLLI